MSYITDIITQLIAQHEPTVDGETMLMINGFDDIYIYYQVAQLLFNKYSSSALKIKIKVAGRKWRELSGKCDTTTRQAMLNNGWIAENESITYYRNLHNSNILILMGAEDEEDTGGLKNCYTITPESLLDALNADYSKIFVRSFSYEMSEADRGCINKMYRDLFEFVAPDIIHLSQMAEDICNCDSMEDFISDYYRKLPEWGLPRRELKLPSRKQIEKKGNSLRAEYQYISRKMFGKISKAQYKNIENKLQRYDNDGRTYSSSWSEWHDQGFSSYSEFSDTLLAYIRGENVIENKVRLLNVDYSIIDEILNIKLPKTSPTLTKEYSVIGDPLKAFMGAYLSVLQTGRANEIADISRVTFEFVQADIVTGYTDSDDQEKKEQLRECWERICAHTNGIFAFLDEPDWTYNGSSLSLNCQNSDFFDLDSIPENLKEKVRTASGTNTLNRIVFIVKAFDAENRPVTYWDASKEKDEDLEQQFCWKFKNESGWLYDFSDLIIQDIAKCEGGKMIPIGVFSKINHAMGVKSEEEFFDLYDESDIDYSFDLMTIINSRIPVSNTDRSLQTYRLAYDELASSFGRFVRVLAQKGFYNAIGSDEIANYIKAYNDLATLILKNTFSEDRLWIIDAFIHVFNIEQNTDFITDEEETECSIVTPWHPAALQKICDQKRFIVDGMYDAWKTCENTSKRINVEEILCDLYRTTEIQSAVDLFPSENGSYFGIAGTYGDYSVYGDLGKTRDIKTRVKDLIKKEAIYDDEFNKSELTRMNDDAQMIYDVLRDYNKALPAAKYNLSLVFINPIDLQPIIAAIYHYTDTIRNENENQIISIRLSILVKPENKGGRNYLTYWMDDYFAQDSNIYIRTYLNEWSTKGELDRILNANNDIVFNMDILHVNTFSFTQYSDTELSSVNDCRFPIVYKPAPLSQTTKKRKVELSQPQFSAAFNHTQVVRYRKNLETIPQYRYIAQRESCLDKDELSIINLLHDKAYWVVCVDRVMDGALLKGSSNAQYSIIGFSTGKGTYGQYNLTITARNSMLETVKERLGNRLYQLFHWDHSVLDKVVQRVVSEAGTLDGISLLSAINQNDNNINEFMAYVLTSLREREIASKSALKIIIHLDSYQHWFSNVSDSSSRPDFLMLSVLSSDDVLMLKATVIECKISSYKNAPKHIEKAKTQVAHGLEQLQQIFDPMSTSIERRYWFSQLYRALVFAQITFSDNTSEFSEMTRKLRAVLDGQFSIDWSGEVLGYWFDLAGIDETKEVDKDNIAVFSIPQQRIQQILTDSDATDYVDIAEEDISDENEDERGKELEEFARQELEEENARMQKKSQNGRITASSSEVERGGNYILDIPSETEKTRNLAADTPAIMVENLPIADTTNANELPNVSKKALLVDTRIRIGRDRNGNEVYWEFGNPQLANRHLLITGTSGQGKTYSIQTMLYEISKTNVSSVIFDYTEGFRQDQLERKFVEKMQGRIDQRVVYFTGVPINPFKRNEIEVAGTRAPEKISDVAQRIANILKHVYGFGDQQFAAIFEACRIGLEKYKEAMNMQYLKTELENSTNKAAKTVVSKMAPFFQSVEFTGEELDWKDVLYQENGKVTIFQLTNFVRDMQVIITEFLLWDMWHYSKKYGSKDKPFVVVLDEAQNLSHTLDSPSGLILTEGRKFGWSAWYATQSTKILSDDEIVRLLQSAFKMYFKPTDEEVIAMAKQLNPSDFSEWRMPLTNLKKGQCIVVGSRIQKDGKFGIGRPTITGITSFEDRD